MTLWLVTTKKIVEEDWRVSANTAEEAVQIVKGYDPEADERVITIEDLGWENLEIIGQPYKV